MAMTNLYFGCSSYNYYLPYFSFTSKYSDILINPFKIKKFLDFDHFKGQDLFKSIDQHFEEVNCFINADYH